MQFPLHEHGTPTTIKSTQPPGKLHAATTLQHQNKQHSDHHIFHFKKDRITILKNYIWPDILANVSFIYFTYYNYFNQIGIV
jgi:hypothetical protein